MVRDTRKTLMDYQESTESENEFCYEGINFKIKADSNNPLEVSIIDNFKKEAELQSALEYSDPNKKFHPEGSLGVHIEQCLNYCDRMSKLYHNWERDRKILRPAVMMHDLCKLHEAYLGGKHPRLVLEMDEILYGIGDDEFHKLLLHHDDHYKFYRRRNNKGIGRIFKKEFMGFTQTQLEVLVRFGYADRYRKKPKDQIELENYHRIKRQYCNEMEWFIAMAKKTSLLTPNFRAFS